jgi:hypothetical protein
MREFLENNWNFEVDMLKDTTLGRIEQKFEELTNTAKMAANFKSIALFFIYYSGHGTIRGRNTFGHTVSYQPIPIEEYVRKLARYANTCVLALFDCCRIEEIEKGSSISKIEKPLNG